MRRPSPSPQRLILGKGLWWQVLSTEAGSAAASLAAGRCAARMDEQVQPCGS